MVWRANAPTSTPPRILVSSGQPLPRQRFSISHELAHLLLHDETIQFHPHYFKRQFDQKEIDADLFAAELLMPSHLLTASLSEAAAGMSVEQVVLWLSQLYQVSFLAMSTRLHNLGLITRTIFNQLSQVKPTQLTQVSPAQARIPFLVERIVPDLIAQLTTGPQEIYFTAEEVRKLQEMAYTRYIGETALKQGHTLRLDTLNPANEVYEAVALWVARTHPLAQTLA